MMASEELYGVRLKDDFYRDGFYKALTAFFILLVAILMLVATSLYIRLSKPSPVTFTTGNDFRILSLVPVDQPYIKQPDLIQWVSVALPSVFTCDFVNYQDEIKRGMQYFTDNGWRDFSAILNVYANSTTVFNDKLFVNAVPAGAPIIQNQGLLKEGSLNGVYGWWIQMPINISYSSGAKPNVVPLMIQVLVVRISTINSIAGVAIEKMIVSKGGGDQVVANG